MKRVAIVLFQLGGPDTQAAVEPFLYNLFCDPDIIDFPLAWIARKPLAKLISTRRSKVVAEHYAEIGGGSPIGRLTAEQGRALEAALSPYIEAKTFVAMRYWHPLTSEALAALAAWPHDELVLLPLYPHYSYATTRSSLKEWKRQTRNKLREPARIIESFYDHPAYIEALRERVDEKLSKLDKSRRSPPSLQRPRPAAKTDRKWRSLSHPHQQDHESSPRARPLAQQTRPLLSKPRRPAKMAGTLAYPNN